jgi:hypothetical protein
MDSRIELMDRRRRSLLTWLFWGFGIWYGMLIAYGIAMVGIGSCNDPRFRLIESIRIYYFAAGGIVLAVFLFCLVRWWLFKGSLQRDPALRAAVNDELVQQSWFKAYRFSFFALIILFAALQVIGTIATLTRIRELIFVTGTIHTLYFYVAIMSCLGSFLYYTREL